MSIEAPRGHERCHCGRDWARWGVDGPWVGLVSVQRFRVAVRGASGYD